MKKQLRFYALIFAVIFIGCSASLRGGGWKNTVLQKSAQKYLHNLYLKGSSWSIMAVDLGSGRILLNIDPDRGLLAASGMKLLTSACALETLGPEYTITTPIGYTGTIDSAGVLHGNLCVIGSGDPSISTRYAETYSDRRTAPVEDTFTIWADSLAGRGIKRIAGDLVGYSGLFGGTAWGSSWEWNELKYWYAAEINPLSCADDCVEITVTAADSAGSPATLTCSPQPDCITLRDEVITIAASSASDLYFDRELQGNEITVWGEIPVSSEPQKLRVAVYDAAKFFLLTMEKSLTERGITISGATRSSSEQPPEGDSFQTLYTHRSPPLSALLRVINRDSQNLYTELMLRVLGAELIRRGDPLAKPGDDAFTVGRNQIRNWESKLRGASPGLVMVDASGLSRRDLISASGLIKILAHMNRSPQRGVFINSLATPGTGTLKGRFALLPRDVNLYAKSGTMTRVKSLSGYLALQGNPRIAFSILCNNYLCDASEVEQTLENLIQIMALHLMESK